MAQNFIETFLKSTDEQRISMYPQLFPSLKGCGFGSVGNIVELSIEDCTLEEKLAVEALNFLNVLLSDSEVNNDMRLRKAVLDGAQKALNSETTRAIFVAGKQPEWKVDSILKVWSVLFQAFLKAVAPRGHVETVMGKNIKEHRVVLNLFCPPLRAAIVSTDQYVAQVALSVWRSLTETLLDSVAHSTKTVCNEANLIVILEFLLKPLKYLPDSYTTMKFEIWLHLAIALSQCSSYSFTRTTFELVLMGLMRMSIGGSLKTVESESVKDSLICEAVSSDSVMVVEKCISRCAQGWMERRMNRHDCLVEKGILLIASLLDVEIPDNPFESLSSAQMHFIPSLLISACIRVYSFCLAKNSEALARVHLQLESVWAALTGAIVLKHSDTSERTSHLRHVISSYIAWISECQLPNESIIRSYSLLCNRAHFLNLSPGFTVSDVFVALFRKVSFNVNSTLLRQISELTISKLMACKSVIRLDLFRCIIFGCLPQNPAEKHNCNAIPVLWDALAKALITHISETEELNEGTSRNVDYSTVDRILLCPVDAHCCSGHFLRNNSSAQFQSTWQTLYSSVQTIRAREINSNCFSYALKTFHKLIEISAQIQQFPDENRRRESCAMVSHILLAVVEKFPFSALGVSIFEAGTGDPIEVLCKAISAFGDSLLNVIDSKGFDGLNASELDDHCASIDHLLVALNCAFSALAPTLYHVTIVTNLAPFLAHLIQISTDCRFEAIFKRSGVKVHRLLKISFKSIKEHYSGPYCSEMLSKFEPLFISALGCANYSIRSCVVTFWRETFANTSQLHGSSQMREALMSVKSRQRLTLPIVSHDNNTFTCNNQDSTVSHPFNQAPHSNNNSTNNLSQSQENVPIATPLTPIRHDENAERKTPVRSSSRKKRCLDAVNDESQFEVIEPHTPTRKMRLTERQKEKLSEKSSSLSSLNSQQNPQSQSQSTQPISGNSDRAEKKVDEEGKDGFVTSEIMEETPPRELAQSPNKTAQRLCRNADIRNYLSPSGAVQKSPQKSKGDTSASSNAPKRRSSTRLRVRGLSQQKKKETDDDDDERQELVDSIEIFSQSDPPPSQEQHQTCSSAEPDLNLLITDTDDDGSDDGFVDKTDESGMGVVRVSPTERTVFGTLEAESPEPDQNDVITTPPPNIPNNQPVTEAPHSQQSVTVVRRVHFDVSQIDGEPETEATRSSSRRRFRRRPAASLFHTAQEKASSQQAPSNVSSPSPSRGLSLPTNGTVCTTKAAIFPALMDCSDPIPPQMFFKLGGPCGFQVRNAFKALGISTIGDLARLNEGETHLLSVRKPQSGTIRSALQDYFASSSSSQTTAVDDWKITDGISETVVGKEVDDSDERKPFQLSAETLKMVEPIILCGESSEAVGDSNLGDHQSPTDETESSSESTENASAEILSSQEDLQQQTAQEESQRRLEILSELVMLNAGHDCSVPSKAVQSIEEDDDDLQLINIEELEGAISKEQLANERPIENDSTENAQLRTQSPPASDTPKQSGEHQEQQSKSLLLTALRNRNEDDTEIQVSLDDSSNFLASNEGISQVGDSNVEVGSGENVLSRAITRDDELVQREDLEKKSDSLKNETEKCVEKETKTQQSEEISAEILLSDQQNRPSVSSANANLNETPKNQPIQTSNDIGDSANSAIQENTDQTVATGLGEGGENVSQLATTSGQQVPVSKQQDVWNEAWQAFEQISALIQRPSDPLTSTKPSSEQLFAINKKLSLAQTLLLAKKAELDRLLFDGYYPQK
ncbi:unnamed protein product [Anisakis simplex]|uniref:Rif1_N domain-containing protein n=1 Tax=Anisakis simplex TaxID=6269 RepID=A0A158PNN3_ANISI|nr:unnamed protein product [Anisakis simplex]